MEKTSIKSDNILISVITPTFNRVDFLKECIQSVQASIIQPFQFQFEHIVADDGSTDDTAEVMARLVGQYSNLTYIRNTDNRGGSAVLNQAIKASRGEWIFVLDDDDVTFQRTLLNFAKTIEEYGHKHSWFVFDFIRGDQNLQYLVGQDYYGWEFENLDKWFRAILTHEHFLEHNTIYKKSLWSKVSGYDESLRTSKDIDMYFRFIFLKKCLPKYSPIHSHVHRFHNSNISLSKNVRNMPDPSWIENVLAKYPELKSYLKNNIK